MWSLHEVHIENISGLRDSHVNSKHRNPIKVLVYCCLLEFTFGMSDEMRKQYACYCVFSFFYCKNAFRNEQKVGQ